MSILLLVIVFFLLLIVLFVSDLAMNNTIRLNKEKAIYSEKEKITKFLIKLSRFECLKLCVLDNANKRAAFSDLKRIHTEIFNEGFTDIDPNDVSYDNQPIEYNQSQAALKWYYNSLINQLESYEKKLDNERL